MMTPRRHEEGANKAQLAPPGTKLEAVERTKMKKAPEGALTSKEG
jgi:hypothetical protein